MAKGNLARREKALRLWIGVTAAAVIALIETINFALVILRDYFHFDSQRALGRLGIIGEVTGRFFGRLQMEFQFLARLARGMPAADLSLLFAGLSVLAAYIWIEGTKARRRRRMTFVPAAMLTLMAAPVVLSLLSVAMA
ncbi:MAG TPA: hypothetical protein VG839_04325 [Asticcacaulis sp.]|nr:hypothetical protein [Asticcacaulis sp.]